MCVHQSAGACRDKKRASDPMALVLLSVQRSGSESPDASAGNYSGPLQEQCLSTLNHRAIFPDPVCLIQCAFSSVNGSLLVLKEVSLNLHEAEG